MAEEKPLSYEHYPEIDILRIFRFLLHYRWFIIITTTGIALAFFLFFFLTDKVDPAESLFPDIYRPASLLLINDKGGNNALAALQNLTSIPGSLGMAGSLTSTYSYGELAIGLLRSKTLLDTIAGEFDLSNRYKIKANPVGRTRQEILTHLYTEYNEKTMLITIGYEDYDPGLAARVVNRFVELLDQRFLSIGGNKSITQKTLLEKNLLEVTAQMATLESAIQKFQNKYGVLDIESLAMEQVTMMAGFRSQLILTEMEIKTYTSFSNIEDPVIKRLRAEQESLSNLIQDMESGYSEANRVFPAQKDLSELALEFYHLERDLKVQEKIYEILSQQHELLKLSLANTEPIFQVIEQADIPDLKIKPRRGVLCIITALGGFIFSLVCIFFHYILTRKHPERQPIA